MTFKTQITVKNVLTYISAIAMIIIILASLAIRLFSTEKIPFIMDELVDTQIACQLEKGSNLYIDYKWIRTPLLNIVLSKYVGKAVNSFYAAVTARKLMWAITLLIFLGTFLISKRIHGFYFALLSLTILSSYTTFLDRSIRVRADLLSTLSSLPALWVLLSKQPSLYQFAFAGLSLGVAFLFTQKALYFVIAFGLALIGRELSINGLKKSFVLQLLKKSVISSLFFFIPIVLFLIWLNATDQYQQFIDNGILNAGKAGLISNVYKESTKIFLRQTVFRNFGIWIFGIYGIIIASLVGWKQDNQNFHRKKTTARYTAISLWTFTLLILVLRHKIKFPYVFINLSPSISICAAIGLFSLYSYFINYSTKSVKFSGLILVFVGFLAILYPSLIRHYKNIQYNDLMIIQKSNMDRVDLITIPNDYVFDGIGMAVTRKKATPYSMTARWFNERNEHQEYDIINWLKANQPIVMILNYRIKRLNINEKKFINDNFLHDWGNVYVAGKRIMHSGEDITKKNVDILASAEYAVIADYCENVLIDGQIPGKKMTLSAGRHEVKIRGERQEIMLKLYRAVKNPLPFQRPFQLYPSYKD